MTDPSAPLPDRVPVLIAGGGPVGLALSALLARHGVASLVVEADDGYCTGSRAICMSRRSQEILGWVGADRPLVAKGLSWVGGRSFYRDTEVLHFQMPSEPTQRFAPMLNIQQYFVEQFAHEAARAFGALADLRWSSRVASVRPHATGAAVVVQGAHGAHTVQADWVVACDGGRSTVREELGLQLEGTQYEGRYVIVDIVQKTRRPVERLAWFDPPSNPGSTLLMHRQPDDVWRIDYQVRDDEDPAEAVRPENVLPRVRAHLDWIGERDDWQPVWISAYRANCLTLERYRHGRVLFAGDAAHLVPIFGVRGMNSGIDDAHNLAWKLARVVQGGAREDLLESYSSERVFAARENIRHASKSTEFMAPPNAAFRLMRAAALGLAARDPWFATLINPRQTGAITFADSPLNAVDSDALAGGPVPGAVLAECPVAMPGGRRFLTELTGPGHTLLAFGAMAGEADGNAVRVPAAGNEAAYALYGAAPSACYLVRPDGHVAGRWTAHRPESIRAAMEKASC